jgi:ubiquinone/menaquinone biosynthesis C-methylase UbiE
MTMPGADRPTFAEIYERELVAPLFSPFADVLLDRVRIGDGDRLLDVACGTGIVARAAKERLADRVRVVGIDMSPVMLAVARRVAPALEWREGSAEALPLASGEQFDVVTCHQGLQFFGDRAAAVREMHRALAPAGRLAVATWKPLAELPLFRDLHGVAERRLGPVVDRRHAFGESQALVSLVTAAGFSHVVAETVSRTIRLPDASRFLFLNAMALVGMSAGAPALGDGERAELAQAIAGDSASIAEPYKEDLVLAFDIATNVITARR